MKIVDTVGLDQRAQDKAITSVYNYYHRQHGDYPSNPEGVIITPVDDSGILVTLHVEGQDEVSIRFNEQKLNARDVKLPPRDLNEYNIK